MSQNELTTRCFWYLGEWYSERNCYSFCFSYNEDMEDLQVEPDIFEDYEAEEQEEAEQGFSQPNSGKSSPIKSENHLSDNKNSESHEIFPQEKSNEGNNTRADPKKLLTPLEAFVNKPLRLVKSQSQHTAANACELSLLPYASSVPLSSVVH